MKYLMILVAIAIMFAFVSCKNKGGISEADIPPTAQKVNAKFENDGIELLSFYTEPLKPRHGDSFKLITFWKFSKKLPEGEKLFYHFEDESGEQRFITDRSFLDGKVKEIPVGVIVRDEAGIKEIPRWFDSDSLVINLGFFKGDSRLVPEKKFNDGKDRLKLPAITIDKPNIVHKKIKAFVVASESRKQIKIDGKLKESFWENAQTGGKFWTTSGDNIAPVQTELKVAFDDKYLYLSFFAEDKDIYAGLKNDGDPIYDKDDVVEVFIDANGDMDNYYELQVSAANVIFESYFWGGPRGGKNKTKDTTWRSGMKHAVTLDGTLNNPKDEDKGWTAEMAIPFAAIKDAPNTPPKDGDKWKVFFYRINRYSDKEATAADFTGWQPPYVGDFHNIKLMGELTFVYEEIL